MVHLYYFFIKNAPFISLLYFNSFDLFKIYYTKTIIKYFLDKKNRVMNTYFSSTLYKYKKIKIKVG
jgi:hypothetical protein